MPIIVTLVAGVCDYGWYLTQMMNLEESLRDAGRVGAADTATPTTTATARLTQAMQWAGLDVTHALISATANHDAELDGRLLVISAEIPFNAPIGLVPTPERVAGQISMLVLD
jgi:hypothetical protein